jgi:hypothetical protein
MNTPYTIEVNHIYFNCGDAHESGIGNYSTTYIKLAILYYSVTVQNVVYALCINLDTLSKP